jgi:histidine triad (HIT) family protein
MTEPCTFCQIIRREAPSSIVYEDETVIAFMSNRPVNPGHTLIVPRRHYENIHQISEEELEHVYKVVKRVASAVNGAIHPEGIRVVQNNGEAAGQVIPHFHVHVIPLYKQAPKAPLELRDASALEIDAGRIRPLI